MELIVYRVHGVDTDESATTSFRPPRQLSWLLLLSCEKKKTLFSQSRSENPTDKYTRQSLPSYGRPPVEKKDIHTSARYPWHSSEQPPSGASSHANPRRVSTNDVPKRY